MRGTPWTHEQLMLLLENYSTLMTCEELSLLIGRSQSSIYNKAQSLGLKKPLESFIQSGRQGTQHPKAVASRFQKGHVPDNKGKKMTSEVYEKVKGTMFGPGHLPQNHRPVGSERVNVDGYIEVKVAEPRKWMLKHRVIWENAHGPIPKGYNIQFRNHNSQDCRLENLYIISHKEQMAKENSFYARYPKEMQDVIHLKGCINRQIHKYEKNNEQY